MSEKNLLLEDLAKVRKKISDLKSEIKDIKTTQYKTGQYEPVEVFDDLQKQLAENILIQDVINAELSKLKSIQQNNLQVHFMNVCREEIDEEDFLWILNEAKRRMEKNDLPESATETSMIKPATP